jgi:[acyl-carrier-protein] S-malonyltransferase
MLAEIAGHYAEVPATFAEASEVLGYDLWQVCSDGPAERLSSTEVTQPALLTAGVALWRAWNAQDGFTPDVMAGHSLGEYTALVCAESFDFADGLRVVEARGRFMQEAVEPGAGAMAAIIGLDNDAVRAACDGVDSGVVAAVNFNAPGQVVIAGERAAVDAAIDAAKAAGARRAIALPVSVPSHCELMKPAAERLKALLEDIDLRMPTIPVINNVDVAAVSDPRSVKEALVRQLYNPVRWVETMKKISRAGAYASIECGPGRVLTGLLKRIDRRLTGYSLDTPAHFAEALAVKADDDD